MSAPLTPAVGLENAFWIVYTADLYVAAHALQMGLVGEGVRADLLSAHARALATRIAEMPTLQLALSWMEILKGMTLDDRNFAMMMEVHALGVAQRSHNYEEGHASFIEKREQRFTGH